METYQEVLNKFVTSFSTSDQDDAGARLPATNSRVEQQNAAVAVAATELPRHMTCAITREARVLNHLEK